jgi:hypothetical protein
MTHPGFVPANAGALDSRLRGNDGEPVPTPGFVIPAKAGTQGISSAAKTEALDSRLRGNDGEPVPTPGFVIPAKAGTQGISSAAKTKALDSRLHGNDGDMAHPQRAARRAWR